jgi:hypothetical protein
MNSAERYPDQFATTPDLLHVAIPRVEIIAEMSVRGEQETLDDVCMAVAVVADAVGTAQLLAASLMAGVPGRADATDQRPCQLGLRFSANAFGPSTKS